MCFFRGQKCHGYLPIVGVEVIKFSSVCQKQPPQDDSDGATVSFRMVVSVIPMKHEEDVQICRTQCCASTTFSTCFLFGAGFVFTALLSRSEQHRTHVGVIETRSGIVLGDGVPEWWKAPFDSVGGVVSTEVVTQSSKPLLQMFTWRDISTVRPEIFAQR